MDGARRFPPHMQRWFPVRGECLGAHLNSHDLRSLVQRSDRGVPRYSDARGELQRPHSQDPQHRTALHVACFHERALRWERALVMHYDASIEHCKRHLLRTVKALRDERTYYTAHPDGDVLVSSIDAEIERAENAIEALS